MLQITAHSDEINLLSTEIRQRWYSLVFSRLIRSMLRVRLLPQGHVFNHRARVAVCLSTAPRHPASSSLSSHESPTEYIVGDYTIVPRNILPVTRDSCQSKSPARPECGPGRRDSSLFRIDLA